ncbi:MAG: hypothetical protein P8Z30_12710 [Acidobacteriota bacterium]
MKRKVNHRAVLAALALLSLSAAACLAASTPVLASPKALAEQRCASAPMKRKYPLPAWQSIQITPRPGLPKIHFYNKLNPVWWFKNSDEPIPPDWYKPNDKHRVLKWHFRNPLHNFDNYVIGIADKSSVRSGRFPLQTSNPHGGWNFAISRRKLLVLPFVSYRRGRFEFYLGWRERGNFGAKLNFK